MKSGVISFLRLQQQNLQALGFDNQAPNTGTMEILFRALENKVRQEVPEYLTQVTTVCNEWKDRGIEADQNQSGGINWTAPTIIDALFGDLHAALGEKVAA